MELQIDEFNAEEYIEDFYKPMRISDKRREEREEAARKFREVLLFLFALIATYEEYTYIEWEYITLRFREEFEKVAIELSRDNEDVRAYVNTKTQNFIETTQTNMGKDDNLSDKRATMEAVNDSNDVVGYEEWQDAIDAGYTMKVWRTERDNKVRPTHREVDGVRVPIDGVFVLEKGILRYPGDYEYCPEETYNCRCSLDFE